MRFPQMSSCWLPFSAISAPNLPCLAGLARLACPNPAAPCLACLAGPASPGRAIPRRACLAGPPYLASHAAPLLPLPRQPSQASPRHCVARGPCPACRAQPCPPCTRRRAAPLPACLAPRRASASLSMLSQWRPAIAALAVSERFRCHADARHPFRSALALRQRLKVADAFLFAHLRFETPDSIGEQVNASCATISLTDVLGLPPLSFFVTSE